MPSATVIIQGIAFALLSAVATAQGPVKPPAKLAEFRAAFEKAVASRSAPALKTLSTDLEALASERTAAGDYEGAMRARDRRITLLESQLVQPDDSSGHGDDEIVVDLAAGTRSGSGVKYDANAGKMIGLSRTSQSIRWELTKTKPGIYSALVTYSCGEFSEGAAPTGGKFTLQEVTSLTTRDSAPLVRTVAPTGGWDQPITRNIGRLNVTGSSLSLKLSITEAGAGGLMHLYAIRLVPVPGASSGGINSPGAVPTTELSELKSQFGKAIRSASKPTIDEYRDALRALREMVAADQDPDATREIQQAQEGAEIIAEDPTSAIPELTSDVERDGGTRDVELTLLESGFRNQLIDIRKDLGKQWLAALTSLKDQLTREQKFAEAILVRSELQRVEEMLEGDPLPAEESAPLQKVTLDPRQAQIGPGDSAMRPTRDGKGIGYWSQPGTSVSWDIPPDIPPGTYELILHFQCGTDGGGKFSVQLGEEPPLLGEVTASASGSWREPREILIGEGDIDQHTGQLTIKSIEHTKTDLMNVMALDLAPQGTWASMRESIPASERKFEKLEGARWVDSDERRPGEFVVKHNDKQYTFRPYFIQIPPTEQPATKSARAKLSRAAKQLRTTEDRLLRFGKTVDEGLRESVWTEDLTIYTSWETRGREKVYLAFILVGDVPVSQTLIEKGDARIGGSFPTSVPFITDKKRTIKVYLQRLRDAEKAAKQRRRGLWGL